MSEKIVSQEKNGDHGKDQLREEGEKQAERLREQLERAERTHKERSSDDERQILDRAKELAEKHSDEQKMNLESPAERRRGPLSKKQLDTSFASQMTHAREHMGPASKAFSRFIHAKPIEVTSDFISSTIARPNALLTGSIVAFLTVTILYFIANHYGFRLSGFETIGAFIIGWILGALYDYVSVAFRRNKED